MISYNFCPLCGTALVMRRIDERERRACPACSFIQWGNSKATAALLLFNDRGEILLGKRNIAPYRGFWTYPGGFLEAGEHPENGARRELREETGVVVEELHYLGVFMETYSDSDATGEDLLNFYYVAQFPEDAVLAASDDMESLHWVTPHALDLNTLAFPANRAALRAWLAQNAASS